MFRRSRRSAWRSVSQISDENTTAAMILRMISVKSGSCSSSHTSGTRPTRMAMPAAKRMRNCRGVAWSNGVLRSRSVRQKNAASAMATALPSVAKVNSVG